VRSFISRFSKKVCENIVALEEKVGGRERAHAKKDEDVLAIF
jgi:hypothetical protein